MRREDESMVFRFTLKRVKRGKYQVWRAYREGTKPVFCGNILECDAFFRLKADPKIMF